MMSNLIKGNTSPVLCRRNSLSNRQFSGFGAEAEFLTPVANFSFQDDDELEAASPAAVAQPEPDPDASAVGPIVLTTRVEYSALPQTSTQDVFGLVTIQTEATSEQPESPDHQEAQPMDIVCVLDVSGSMDGEKIKQVQEATRFIISQAGAKDRLSIVSFNSSATRELRFRKMDAAGKDSATVASLRLRAGGGTSISAGLDVGLQVMEQRRQRNKVSAILLLTDGQDSGSRRRLPALVLRAQQQNCALYSFGFGRDHDAALLSELAEHAKTPFTYVEDTEKVGEAFAGAVGGLSSVVAQGLELRLKSQVCLKALHTPFRVQRTSETEALVSIPDVFAGERRDILVELAVPVGGDETGQIFLLEAVARYTDLRRSCLVQTAPVVMEVHRVEEPQPEAEPDTEVRAQRERVELTQALQAAAVHSDQGQFDDARRVLEVAETKMRANKKTSPINQLLLEELEDARGRMRSRDAWEHGGRAEVSDACQMHKMQRCTNNMQSSSSRQKASKGMYLSSVQDSWVSRSKA